MVVARRHPRERVASGSCADRRPTVRPRTGCFELCRQPEEGGLIAETADEVRADGETVGIPVFQSVAVFSMSAFLRGLKEDRLTLALPDTAERIQWIRRIFNST